MSRLARSAVYAGLLAALVLPALAGAAVELKRLDARGYPTVRAAVVTGTSSATAPVLRENGGRVSSLRAENLGSSRSVVLAIDTSRSMSGQSFDDAVAAAKTFLATKQPGDRVAVVAFGRDAIQLTGFSTAAIDAEGALRSLSVEQREGTALYDAIRLSSRALRSEALGARVIVLVTDGRDVSSEATAAQATKASRAARAAVYPVGIEGEQFSPQALHRIANETGGSYRGASSTAALPRIYKEIAAELRRTWRIEYATAARPGETVRLRATVQGQGTDTRKLEIPESAGAGTTSTEASSGLLPNVLHSSAQARWLFALLIGLLVLFAVRLLLSRPTGHWVQARVAGHVEPPAEEAKRKPGRRPSTSLAGLYRVTEEALGSKRTWGRVEGLLKRADVPLRTAEFLYLSLACGLIAALLCVIFSLPTLVTVGAFAAGALAPPAVVWRKSVKRVRAFEAQLPDLLITLAASLRAGHSLRQAIQSAVEEGKDPAKKEFGRVMAEARLGRPMEEGLADMARRLNSNDFDYVVTAVTIQREVGGALASLFDMVADTVRDRQQFHRKVRSLTAMGRLSALILIVLPFLVAAALTALNPDYMRPLYDRSSGHTLIGVGLVMMVFGSLILKRIVSFKG